jgi:hypothetical protein
MFTVYTSLKKYVYLEKLETSITESVSKIRFSSVRKSSKLVDEKSVFTVELDVVSVGVVVRGQKVRAAFLTFLIGKQVSGTKLVESNSSIMQI